MVPSPTILKFYTFFLEQVLVLKLGCIILSVLVDVHDVSVFHYCCATEVSVDSDVHTKKCTGSVR